MLRLYLPALLIVLSSLSAAAQKERHFIFHYSFTVKNVTRGERLRVWIPMAYSDASQDVQVVSQTGDLPLKQVREPSTGTRFYTPKLRRPIRASTNSPLIMMWRGESTWCWSTENQCQASRQQAHRKLTRSFCRSGSPGAGDRTPSATGCRPNQRGDHPTRKGQGHL
jgi:hypothetical protein